MKPSGPGHFFVESFLITDSILLVVISLLRFMFLLGSVLENCIFLGIILFIPGCPMCWPITIVFSYNSLYFCDVNWYFFFTSEFIYLGPLSFFFLMSLVKGLSIFWSFKIKFIRVTLLIKLYRFQVHNSIICHLYVALCAYHPM